MRFYQYQLAEVLYEEAIYVDVQAVLVSEDRLRRYQRRVFRNVQGRMHEYWAKYIAGDVIFTTPAQMRTSHGAEGVSRGVATGSI